MKFNRISLSLGLTVLSLLCGSFVAQAETASTSDSVAVTPVADATPTTHSAIASSQTTAVATTVPSAALDTLTATAPSAAAAPDALTTAPSAAQDSAMAQQLVANHTPAHAAPTSTEAATATTTEPLEIAADTTQPATTATEMTEFTSASTAAADLTPATQPTTSTAEINSTAAPSQVAQVPTSPVFRRPPGNNYIGVGVNFGDDTSFAVLSKFTLTQFSTYGVALRPAVLFGDSVDFRVPITIGTLLNTDSETANRFAPYAGAGVAIDTEDDTNVDFMLTAGSDFLITNRVTANANLNLIFNDDTDLELLLGVGYNF